MWLIEPSSVNHSIELWDQTASEQSLRPWHHRFDDPVAGDRRGAPLAIREPPFGSLLRRARRFFQRPHRNEVRARAVAHPGDTMLCQDGHRRCGIANHDVERER
jgi:hypothetical protein